MIVPAGIIKPPNAPIAMPTTAANGSVVKDKAVPIALIGEG